MAGERSVLGRPVALPAAVLAAAGAWWAPGAAAHCPPLAHVLRVPLRMPAAAGVALTFDDGPHPQGTPAVLEALAAVGAQATFFLVGEQVQRHASLVREIVAAGHEAAVHAHRHRNPMRLSPRAFTSDLERAVGVIADVLGRTPAYYRPPYGAFTLPALREVRRRGLAPILWSRWGRDWDGRTSPAQIASLAVGEIRAGDVVLLHDADGYCAPGAYRKTVAALPRIVAALAQRRLDAVRLPPVIGAG